MAASRSTGAPRERYKLHLVLRDGFRGHRVVVTVNGRRIYQAAKVSTDPATGRAAAREVALSSPMARLMFSARPGNLDAAFDVDLAERPHVAISLVGERTVAFESSTLPLS
jgi:hypothetical protein